jgi:hypothetical protein
LEDLKKIDPQETEEQLKHQKVERIGGKDLSKLWKSDTHPHRSKDHQKEDEITFSKHSGFLGRFFQFNIKPEFINPKEV